MHARLDNGDIRLLTRSGLDWTSKYPAIAAALRTLPVRLAYLDGELCGVQPDGLTSFTLIQNAAEWPGGGDLVYFVFDLLHLDGQTLMPLPWTDRKARLVGRERRHPVQRSPDRTGLGVSSACLRARARRHRLEAARCRLQPRPTRALAQDQMPQPGGIRRRRLDRSRA
jgi:ATP dependent DNA ligase domain